MSSNLKVNTILPSSGTTVAVSGIASVTSSVSIASSCTATTFFGNLTGNPTGSGANLTNLPAANITGTLPAISGANLTGVLKNIVEDTSPQLGADLDCNQKGILLQDRNSGNQGAIKWGDNGEMWMFHAGSDNTNRIYSSGKEWTIWSGASNDHACIKVTASDTDPAVQLYWNNAAKLYTNANGVNVDKCLQAGSVQTPIESSITFHQSHDPAGLFYPEGAYGNNNSPANSRQAVMIASTKGNWVQGNSSSTHRSIGIKFSRVESLNEQIRAGIQHDIMGTEKFKLWTSYGDIHFRTRNDNNGNKTWEECDKDPLVLHHNGHVSMCNMPYAYYTPGNDSNTYLTDSTEHVIDGAGSATTENGMSVNTSNGRITVPYTGKYLITANIGLNSSPNTFRTRLNLMKNGSDVIRTEHQEGSSTNGGWKDHVITVVLQLAANDYISFDCQGKHDGGVYSVMSCQMLMGTATT